MTCYQKTWGKVDECLGRIRDGTTPEAKFVKALDKAETIIQHNQGDNPEIFDYAFNLEYGKSYFEEDALLSALRKELDDNTLQNKNSKQ